MLLQQLVYLPLGSVGLARLFLLSLSISFFLSPLLFLNHAADIVESSHKLANRVDSVIVTEDPSEGCPSIEGLFLLDLLLLPQFGDKVLEKLPDLIVLGDV